MSTVLQWWYIVLLVIGVKLSQVTAAKTSPTLPHPHLLLALRPLDHLLHGSVRGFSNFICLSVLILLVLFGASALLLLDQSILVSSKVKLDSVTFRGVWPSLLLVRNLLQLRHLRDFFSDVCGGHEAVDEALKDAGLLLLHTLLLRL